MRLTKKTPFGGYDVIHNYDEQGRDEEECIHKLGQLEDIEELCEKIVSQPIYRKFIDTGDISYEEDYTEYYALYNFQERRIEIYGCEIITCLNVEDYGKTWWLEKPKEIIDD